MGGMPHGNFSNSSQVSQVIATVTYERAITAPLLLPQKLPSVESLPQPNRTHCIGMSMSMGMGSRGMRMTSLFNDDKFDMDRIDDTVRLGTIFELEAGVSSG